MHVRGRTLPTGPERLASDLFADPAMSLIARLIELVTETVERPDAAMAAEADHNLAVAALLVHVARVDGSIAESERALVLRLLRGRFGLSEEAAHRLVNRADRLDREIDDFAELIDMLGHGVPEQERRQLVAMAYSVAGADGRIEEFEDDLVWRMSRLLGFDEATHQSIKAEALALCAAPQEQA
jgi:uncharacterized tellurite resistance protein B-like protein